MAEKMFKEEVIKRLGSGCQSVVEFLIVKFGVRELLSYEEIFFAVLIPEEAETILKLNSLLNKHFEQDITSITTEGLFTSKKRRMIGINVENSGLNNCVEQVLELVYNFTTLEILVLDKNMLNYLSESLTNLPHLKTLIIDEDFTNVPRVLKLLNRMDSLKVYKNVIDPQTLYIELKLVFNNVK